MPKTDTFINTFYIKYNDMDEVIGKSSKMKETFLMVNLNYMFNRIKKYIEIVGGDDFDVLNSDKIVYDFLNLLAHYRNYTFNRMGSNNSIIIFVDDKSFTHVKTLEMLEKIIHFFPKIRMIKSDNIRFLKLHCIKEIIYCFRNRDREFYWIDIDKYDPLSEMYTDNYYIIKNSKMSSTLVKNRPVYEQLNTREELKYEIKEYIPFISVSSINKKNRDLIIKHIVDTNRQGGLSMPNREKNLEINRIFGSPETEAAINDIFDGMNSRLLSNIIKNLFKSWGHHVYDSAITNFNELIDTKGVNVSIHKLMMTF